MRFKKSEWSEWVTSAHLKRLLEDHYIEFSLLEWSDNDVDHFLDIHPELYREDYFRSHHKRTIVSIIVEMVKDGN